MTVLFHTDDFRGGHFVDVIVTKEYNIATTIAELLMEADRQRRYSNRRATIEIAPEIMIADTEEVEDE